MEVDSEVFVEYWAKTFYFISVLISYLHVFLHITLIDLAAFFCYWLLVIGMIYNFNSLHTMRS